MIGGFKRYDAAQVTLVFMGILIDSGFADGEFLTIEQSAPDYEVVVGTDGQVGRSRTNNRHATIKVKLMSTSDGNTFFSGLSNLGIQTRQRLRRRADAGARPRERRVPVHRDEVLDREAAGCLLRQQGHDARVEARVRGPDEGRRRLLIQSPHPGRAPPAHLPSAGVFFLVP